MYSFCLSALAVLHISTIRGSHQNSLLYSWSYWLHHRGWSLEIRGTLPTDVAEETPQTLSQSTRVLSEDEGRADNSRRERNRGKNKIQNWLGNSENVCLWNCLCLGFCSGCRNGGIAVGKANEMKDGHGYEGVGFEVVECNVTAEAGRLEGNMWGRTWECLNRH